MATKAAGGGSDIEALLKEKRKFPPPKEFAKRANARSASLTTASLRVVWPASSFTKTIR